jgi:hypothetical protein
MSYLDLAKKVNTGTGSTVPARGCEKSEKTEKSQNPKEISGISNLPSGEKREKSPSDGLTDIEQFEELAEREAIQREPETTPKDLARTLRDVHSITVGWTVKEITEADDLVGRVLEVWESTPTASRKQLHALADAVDSAFEKRVLPALKLAASCFLAHAQVVKSEAERQAARDQAADPSPGSARPAEWILRAFERERNRPKPEAAPTPVEVKKRKGTSTPAALFPQEDVG